MLLARVVQRSKRTLIARVKGLEPNDRVQGLLPFGLAGAHAVTESIDRCPSEFVKGGHCRRINAS